MYKKLLVISVPLLIAACAPPHEDPDIPNDCPAGPAPGQPLNVFYGDARLEADPPVFQIHKKNKKRFQLLPQKKASDPSGVDYDKVEVTIEAKELAKYPWFKASGTEDADNHLVICFPSIPNLPEEGITIEYLIKVEKVGVLDPRVDVIP